MSAASQPSSLPEHVYERYRDNLPRHLLGLSNYLQTRMMQTLQQDYGHPDLRLSFAPYITLAGDEGIRVSQLASILGISRQACNQAAQQVEQAGYLSRVADPDDGRAKILKLTRAGRSLRRDGIRAVAALDQSFADVAGVDNIRDASRALQKLYRALDLSAVSDPTETTGLAGDALGALLPRLADYILLSLMELTREKGHAGLKISFGQVLPFIGASGGRIQQIARLHDVSKQAISAIAMELEELGYLERESHPSDARQVLLQFTPKGRDLIADSVRSAEELEALFTQIVGERDMATLRKVVRDLHHTLQPAHSAMMGGPNAADTDLRLLAEQLHNQLGDTGCRQLARLLDERTAPAGTTRKSELKGGTAG